ncbi:MAG TPA: hypothetical protein PLM04_08300 [Paludibacteraceae bacterium]|nr:MAG: hypothetical protein BWX59_01583 [Bacteroidetes bacterium ADurb.Bin028]HNQ69534.1 hypothetical protein [Bacteroidales bacterium]HNY44435.1 hypothetical protein [Bacteroidales bacterium]HON03107.1 hypothetical protein [Paludibacteraceae bacterium]
MPSAKKQRISGTLYYDVYKGITLELFGDFNEMLFAPISNDSEYDIILGLTSTSKEITLYKTFVSSRGGLNLVQNQEAGIPTSKYIVNYIFEGVHIDKPEDIKFDKLVSEIIDLDEWVGISGFIPVDFEKAKDFCQNKEYQVQYKLPELIIFPLSNELVGQFNFVMTPSDIKFYYQKEVSLKQKIQFVLKYSKEKPVEDLLNDLFKFQTFLILALYKKTYPKSILLYNANFQKDYGNENIVTREIKLYIHIPDRNKKQEKQKIFMDMLFCYRNIKDNFPAIIKKWFEKYNELESVFNLLFEQFYNDKRFTENTFLNLAQAAESFHAHTRDNTRMPKEEYKKMKKEILSVVNEKYHQWLKEQFNFGNHLNLHTRLDEIISICSCEIVDKIIGDKEIFIKQVKNSRNYYTHYSSDLKKKALKGSDLFYLTQKLKIVLVCAFLLEIGFDKNILNQMLDDRKHRFFHNLANW